MSLGAPADGEMSAQMISSGWQIKLDADGETYEYRADKYQLRLQNFEGRNYVDRIEVESTMNRNNIWIHVGIAVVLVTIAARSRADRPLAVGVERTGDLGRERVRATRDPIQKTTSDARGSRAIQARRLARQYSRDRIGEPRSALGRDRIGRRA